MNIFIKSSRVPRKKANDPRRGRDPRLKTTGLPVWSGFFQ